MIQMRASLIQRRYSPIVGEWMVDGRFEIRWAPDQSWVNLGLFASTDLEWRLAISVMMLGARHSDGTIEFSIVDDPLLPSSGHDDE